MRMVIGDKTHYWETRDTNVLLSEVRKMNRIVAHFAGNFHDALRARSRGRSDL
jgi:hypothetical protein